MRNHIVSSLIKREALGSLFRLISYVEPNTMNSLQKPSKFFVHIPRRFASQVVSDAENDGCTPVLAYHFYNRGSMMVEKVAALALTSETRLMAIIMWRWSHGTLKWLDIPLESSSRPMNRATLPNKECAST
jgi:hypothetical protein